MGNRLESSGFKLFWAENKKSISFVLAVISILVLLFSLWATIMPGSLKGDFKTMADFVNVWIWWVLIVSSLTSFIFGYIFWDYYKKEKKYLELIETDSKSEFIKNREELEDLVAVLGPKFETRLIEKEQDLKIK